VKNALFQAGAGRVGDYHGCAWQTSGAGQFCPSVDSSPFIGSPGEKEVVKEYKVELVCEESFLKSAIAAMKEAHPYEEPAYDVYERRGDAGFVGRVGSLTAPMATDGFAVAVQEAIGGVIRVACGGSEVAQVAVVPGSGAKLIDAAAAAGADAIVTGDVGHHQARAAAERGMAVVDPGHAATERPGLARLYAAVSEVAAEVHDLRDVDADPWRPAG
jgi:hypothetical protein